jgi:hypothetical protein
MEVETYEKACWQPRKEFCEMIFYDSLSSKTLVNKYPSLCSQMKTFAIWMPQSSVAAKGCDVYRRDA